MIDFALKNAFFIAVTIAYAIQAGVYLYHRDLMWGVVAGFAFSNVFFLLVMWWR